MVQKKLPFINSSHGSETRNIINELIKLFNGLGYTYDEALYQAKTILNEAKKTNNMNKDVQAQVNKFISEFENEGTTNAEVVQARGDHTVLNERLNLDENKFNRDFKNRNYNKLPTPNLTSNKSKQVLNTFIDDDGSTQVMNKLKPLSIKYDVPFTIALIGKFLADDYGIKVNEALELQNDLGWEIASHEYNHIPLGSVTDPEILELEIKYSQEYIRSLGFDVKNIVYPNGQSNKEIREMASLYYNCGVGTAHGANNPPVDTFNLRRISFPHASANNSLQWYKNIVDTALQNNEWIIWMLHCGMAAHDATNQQILDDLIAYIKSKNIETVNLQEGLERYGNAISLDDDKYYYASNGENNIINYEHLRVNQSTGKPVFNGTTPPKDFELKKTVSTIYRGSWESTGIPSSDSAVFTTVVGEAHAYAHQTYTTSKDLFIRYARNDNAWTDWQRVSFTKKNLILSTKAQTISGNSAIRIPIEDPGIRDEDINVLNPRKNFPASIIWSYSTVGRGLIYLHIYNTSTTPYELTDMNWELSRRT